MANNSRWCFAWFQAKQAAESARPALPRTALWASGQTITVGFLGGDEGLRRRVADATREWVGPGLANVRFDFVDGSDADVRVGFQAGNGSWSAVGTTCRNVPGILPTMNLGWLTISSSDQELRGVVLHEFGHVLGLTHQYENPALAVKWDRTAVMRELLEPSHSWSVDDIEHNVFRRMDSPVDRPAFDPESIMTPVIPASWTGNGYSTDIKSDLSETDRQLIRRVYP